MGRIKGHYEWDDDNLTPGRKREGGLHQNLFDVNGNLKGSARFVPAGEVESEPLVVTETVYLPVEERRRSPEQEALNEAIATLLAVYLERGIAKATPAVARWWRETAWPSIGAPLKLFGLQQDPQPHEVSAAASTKLDIAPQQDRPLMSSAEAKARYLAALAAQAYSDEQMRLVTNADIVDSNGPVSLAGALAELPTAEAQALVKSMATNPAMLTDDTLANLASILGRRALPDPERNEVH